MVFELTDEEWVESQRLNYQKDQIAWLDGVIVCQKDGGGACCSAMSYAKNRVKHERPISDRCLLWYTVAQDLSPCIIPRSILNVMIILSNSSCLKPVWLERLFEWRLKINNLVSKLPSHGSLFLLPWSHIFIFLNGTNGNFAKNSKRASLRLPVNDHRLYGVRKRPHSGYLPWISDVSLQLRMVQKESDYWHRVTIQILWPRQILCIFINDGLIFTCRYPARFSNVGISTLVAYPPSACWFRHLSMVRSCKRSRYARSRLAIYHFCSVKLPLVRVIGKAIVMQIMHYWRSMHD